MSRENSPLICAYKFARIPRAHIYLRILTEFSLQVEIEAYKIQDIYDMNFSLVSTTSQPQDESTIDKSNTNQHSSSHITNQMFKSKHKSQIEFMQDTNHKHVMQ